MKKNLLIVGGTSGLMIPCYEKFLKEYNISATYSDIKNLNKIPKKIRFRNNIKFFKLNFNDSDEIIIDSLRKANIKPDIIINSVGGSFGIKGYSFDLKDWKKLLDLNCLKHILINNFFLKEMKKKNFGRILFFSSIAVDDPNGPIIYSTVKSFLENYVKKSALIFGKYNILINCIKTSIIAAKNNNWYKATKQKPQKVKKMMKRLISIERIGNATDLIDLIVLISSEKNKFVNGSIINADGGVKYPDWKID